MTYAGSAYAASPYGGEAAASGSGVSSLHPSFAGTGALSVHLNGAGIRTVAFAGTGALSVHLNGAGIRVVTFAGTSSLTVSVVGHSGMGSLIFAGTSGLAVTLAGHLADITSLTFVGAGNLAVTLRGHVDQIEPLLFAGSSGFLSVNLGGLIATWPYVLGGIGGSFTVDFSTAPDPAPIDYTPDGDGSLVLIAEDYEPSYIVVDEDGDEQANEAGDTLTVVWSAGQLMEILLTPDPHDPNALVDFTWSYAERASSVLVVFMEDTVVRETPGGLIITISNGRPNDTVTLSTIGPTGVADFQTIALDEFGSFEDLVVDLPALDPGDYYLRVESLISGSEDAGFSVLGQPLTYGDDPKPPDNPPVVDPAQHWRFFDLRDPDVTYTFPRNPKSWTNVYPPNDFTHGKTVAVDGNPLTWQAAARPWRMEFTGWLDTQEEYDDLVFWSQLRRRFWLIDHRNRAWLITIEQFDAQALIKPNLPWAHNYTVKTLVFMQGDME